MSREAILRGIIFPTIIGLALFCASDVSSAANKPRLLLSTHAPVHGGSCDPGTRKILVGTSLELSLANTADLSLDSLKPGWPAGYALEAALDMPIGEFQPVPGLIERLRPQPFWSLGNLHNQWALAQDPQQVRRRDLNSKCFVVHIPADLAGHTLTFRGRFQRGDTLLVSKPQKSYAIIAPCDQSDSARILASWVSEAMHASRLERALALTDSLLERILKTSEEDQDAGEVEEAEIVLDPVLVAYWDSPELREPGEEAFDFPATLVAA